MRLTAQLRISFRALAANCRRSFQPMLGIIIGIASVEPILSLGNGIMPATVKNLLPELQGQQTAEITFNPNSSGAADAGFCDADVALACQTAPDKIQMLVIKQAMQRLLLMGQLANADTTMSEPLEHKTKPNVSLIAGSGFNQDSYLPDGQDA